MSALWQEIGLSLIDSAQDSIYLIDKNYRYSFVNRAHLERLGLDLDEVVGRAYADFHSEAQAEELKSKVDEVLATGRSVQHEHTSVRDGKCFLRTFSPVNNPAGRDILGVLISSKDISDIVKTRRAADYFEKITDALGDGVLAASYDLTARKNAENESRESEMLYRAVAENALCGIVIFREGKYLYLNPHALDYTGYTAEELIGRDVFSLVHPDDVATLKATAGRMLRGETDEPYEYRLFRKDGRLEWVTGRVSFITYKGKRAILAITTDITNLKNTEIALKESEMRYRAVEESAQVGIYISQRRKFKYVNSYIVSRTGYSHEELIDRDPAILVHPDDLADTGKKLSIC